MTRFDPEQLTYVTSVTDIEELPLATESVLVSHLDDARLAALAVRLPQLRHLIADGNNHVSDAGLAQLTAFARLESLDLEWSAVTDAGLPHLAALPSLRWLDLGGCADVSASGLAALRRSRPDLEIEPAVG